MTNEETQSEVQDSLPDAVRTRLRELGAKLESERSTLGEEQLMREAEVTSLQTELKKRGEAWEAERSGLLNKVSSLKTEKESLAKDAEMLAAQRKTVASLEAEFNRSRAAWENEKSELIEKASALKAENESLITEHGQLAVQKETIVSIEAELKRREKTWNEERRQLQADLGQVRKELNAERKQLSETGAEWQSKLNQLLAAAAQGAESEANLRKKLETCEADINKAVQEKARRDDDYRKELSMLEAKHQKQIIDALGALDDMLGKGAKKKHTT